MLTEGKQGGSLIDFRILFFADNKVYVFQGGEIGKWILLLTTSPYGSNQARGWQLGPITVTCS